MAYRKYTLWQWFKQLLSGRPHVTIGDEPTAYSYIAGDFVISTPAPYMLRWYIVPHNRWCNIYLHKFLRSDDDRVLHDHPWSSYSILIRGQYIEHTPDALPKFYKAITFIKRLATHVHRIELIGNKPVWTLFITGRKVQEWGFYCKRGWIHWREFIDGGCGEQE